MTEIIKLGTQYLDGFQLDAGLPYEEGVLAETPDKPLPLGKGIQAKN